MKLAYLAAIAAVSFAISAPVFAAEVNGATNTDQSSKTLGDDTGMIALGVDVTGAGTTPDSVKKWWTAQNADTQKNLSGKCKDALAPGSKAAANIMAFCKNTL